MPLAPIAPRAILHYSARQPRSAGIIFTFQQSQLHLTASGLSNEQYHGFYNRFPLNQKIPEIQPSTCTKRGILGLPLANRYYIKMGLK